KMWAAYGVGIYAPFFVITAIDVLCGTLHQHLCALNDLLVADGHPDFIGCRTTRPLKQVGIAVVVGEIAEFPNTGILLVNGIFDLLEDIIYPSRGIRPLFNHKTMIGIQR